MQKKLWFLVISAFLVTLLLISSTYALFESQGEAETNFEIGKWVIKLNDVDVSKGYQEDFVIDNFIYDENENVEEGYIAPGQKGYFDIVLDPSGTDVAVRYDIEINLSEGNYPRNLEMSVDTLLDNETVKSDDNSYSGIITLDEIKENKKISLRLNMYWNNKSDALNQSDSRYGTVINNSFEIPITVKISQYLGENIEE